MTSDFGPEKGSLGQIGDGVYAYVQPDGGWCLSNSGLVLDEDDAARGPVLIDTAATQARAQRLRGEIERVAGQPPRLVVNTHFHGDHVFGNYIFTPEATVLAHERTRDDVIEAGLSMQMLWPQVEWGDIVLEPPSLTFSERATVYSGGSAVELIHVGPAHTANDVVAWLPQQRILFCGDVALAGATPFCLMGSVEGSLRAVRRLRELDAETIVPGHGPVSGPEILDDAEQYLTWVLDLARQGRDAGRTPLEVAAQADLGAFAKLLDSERLVGNLHRAYTELDGAQAGAVMDIRQPFQEMVIYNGGPPSCHA